jgi:soluble lytic murein transglycosylase-like protein
MAFTIRFFSLNDNTNQPQYGRTSAVSIIALTFGIIVGLLLAAAVSWWGLNQLAVNRPNLRVKLNAIETWVTQWTLPEANNHHFRLAGSMTESALAEKYINLANGQTFNIGNVSRELITHAPDLEPLIRLRAAEQFASQPNEAKAQQQLAAISHNNFKALSQYKLGQSYMRANMMVEAKASFQQVVDQYPDSDEGIGSLYYLAQLADTPNEAQQLALNYLAKAPAGRFANDLINQLTATIEPSRLTSEQRSAFGLALVLNNQPDQAKIILTSGPSDQWVAALTESAPRQRVSYLQQAFSQPPQLNPSEDQINLLLVKGYRVLSPQQQLTLYSEGAHLYGEDAPRLLWAAIMANVSDRDKAPVIEKLLTRYPKSPYAPAAQAWEFRQGWSAAIASPTSKAADSYIVNANTFVNQYPYASDAPSFLFWKAKLYEARQDLPSAKKAYQQLVSNYPITYEGHRAEQLLAKLNGGSDNRWTLPPVTQLPTGTPGLINLNALTQLPDWNALPTFAKKSLTSLIALAENRLTEDSTANITPLLEDAALVLSATQVNKQNTVYAVIDGWTALSAQSEQQPQYHRTIRRVYDAVKALARDGNMAAYQPQPLLDSLLYPVTNEQSLLIRANTTGVPALVGLSLMREESFFNPQATSSSDARGLMQLLVPTAREVAGWEGLRPFDGNNLFTPATNIRLGMRYLEYLQRRFNATGLPDDVYPALMVGAYNGGPNAMARWANSSVYLPNNPDAFIESIPYEQTRTYIKKVFTTMWRYQELYGQTETNINNGGQ